MSLLGRWLRDWRPRTPPLPDVVARLLEGDEPDWFPREMAIAVAPPGAFGQFMLRNFSGLRGPDPPHDRGGGLPRRCRARGRPVSARSEDMRALHPRRCWTRRPAAGYLRP